MKRMIGQLNPFEWVKAKLMGHLPTRFRINKILRITVTRYRPTDLAITLEMVMEMGDWAPVAKIRINGTLGTVTAEPSEYVPPNVIRTRMFDHPGTPTKYV